MYNKSIPLGGHYRSGSQNKNKAPYQGSNATYVFGSGGKETAGGRGLARQMKNNDRNDYHGAATARVRRAHNAFRREFSDVGSESSPVKRGEVETRINSAPTAASCARVGARAGGGGIVAARQLRNIGQSLPNDHVKPPIRPLRDNFMSTANVRSDATRANSKHHHATPTRQRLVKTTEEPTEDEGYSSFSVVRQGRPPFNASPSNLKVPPANGNQKSRSVGRGLVGFTRGGRGINSSNVRVHVHGGGGDRGSSNKPHWDDSIQGNAAVDRKTIRRGVSTLNSKNSNRDPTVRSVGGAAADGRFARQEFRGKEAYLEHPLYGELKSVNDEKAALLVKIAGEKQQITLAAKKLREVEVKESSLLIERKRLSAKLSAVEKQKETFTNIATLAEAKSALADKIAALQLLKDEYQSTVDALLQLDGGGNGVAPSRGRGLQGLGTRGLASSLLTKRSGSTGSSVSAGPRGRLQQTLDQKRLSDEEAACAKYQGMIRKAKRELSEMQQYLDQLRNVDEKGEIVDQKPPHASSAPSFTPRDNSNNNNNNNGESISAPTFAPSTARGAAPSPRVVDQRLQHQPSVSSAGIVGGGGSKSPTRMLIGNKITDKRSEIERLKSVFEQEAKALDLELHAEDLRSRALLEEAADRLANTQTVSGEYQEKVQTLRAAISSKMAAAAQKRSEVEVNKRNTQSNLAREVEGLSQKIKVVDASLKEINQKIEAARIVQSTTLSNNVKAQQETETCAKASIQSLAAKADADLKRAATLTAEKEKITKKTKANVDLWAQQDGVRRKLVESYEKAMARRDEVKQSLEGVKAQQQKELESLAFASQKKEIIVELRSQFDKESLKLADIEKQNAQLEKTLGAIVDLLKRNNVEFLF